MSEIPEALGAAPPVPDRDRRSAPAPASPPAPSWGELPPGGRQTVANVRAAPGELSFDVSIAGLEQTIWLETDAPVTPNADAALAATLMPAMRTGGTLAIDAPISARLLRTQLEFQAIQRVWQREWTWDVPPLREVEVEAAAAEPRHGAPTGRVATFFSGRVDSLWAVLEHPEVTDLIFVQGFDIPLTERALGERVERRLRAAAASLGLPLIVVRTNLRDLNDRAVPWGTAYGCGLAAVALLHAPLFDRVLMAGDSD